MVERIGIMNSSPTENQLTKINIFKIANKWKEKLLV